MKNAQSKDKGIILALDTDSSQTALAWVNRFRPYTPYFKVGLELFTAAGPAILEAIAVRGGKVFLDLKYHDIPNTVEGACRAAARRGVWMLTVHSQGGADMMMAARRGLDAAATEAVPLLMGVTVLTSAVRTSQVAQNVVSLSVLARQSGCDGVISSGEEAAVIRQACGGQFLIVTPGIRLAGQTAGDQVRVMTPQAAFSAGSDFLVMGRGILQSPDPEAVLAEILT